MDARSPSARSGSLWRKGSCLRAIRPCGSATARLTSCPLWSSARARSSENKNSSPEFGRRPFVEEANLKIQVSALRRALGDGQGGRRFVATIPGRGYNFVAPISVTEPPRPPRQPAETRSGAHNLPHAATRMIGREEAMAAVASRLSSGRFVTIVGPGGIGKTDGRACGRRAADRQL